jgi:hypothetical protein
MSVKFKLDSRAVPDQEGIAREPAELWPFTIKPHRFEASYSGMVCGAMVEDVNGNGDQCGRPAGDPVHQGGEAGQPARVAAPA